ncbi:HpcH/HpaI aldolase family protein [Jannaschia rubra]|uniref:5-keto-4-deoxy-D-glucarate aldolase n=1 Tax=Jannaschia rubra TaxID=282197 RepID=A0A0M6XMD4_9RHOB|nr:aldolase/citrate lyase family protein [Jannaschia rubra]CTQ32098.1 5-keto-4-deoxy-D-glucarate aldolase [Jannaschia rubra]SFG37651.1 2-keto-3-deoxy-L-rhamnonate aldolase RhmA [Jannaschia rubra]
MDTETDGGATGLRARMQAGELLAGTFMKTPSHITLEILILGGLDFVCIDAEHAPFDRAAMDACMAVARARDFPVLVRIGDGSPARVLDVLDMGATGIVVPHVDSVEKARAIAAAARFGRGGRGYAGSTRWAGYTAATMPDLLARSRAETIVLAQIEEPEGVEAAEAIAAVEGIDALFTGPADLSVAYGHSSLDNPDLPAAMEGVGRVCAGAGKCFVTWVPDVETARKWRGHGFTMFFVASEHAWMIQGARAVGEGIRALT